MGIGTQHAEPDDLIVVLRGCSVLRIIRRHSNGTYRFIGECVVEGIMFGEALEGMHKVEILTLA